MILQCNKIKMAEKVAEAIPPSEQDLKMFVVYTSEKNRDSLTTKVLDALKNKPKFKLRTLIVDADLLSKKPEWMKVLPMLVVKEEKKAYGGQECIDYIDKHPGFADQRHKPRNGSQLQSSKNFWKDT